MGLYSSRVQNELELYSKEIDNSNIEKTEENFKEELKKLLNKFDATIYYEYDQHYVKNKNFDIPFFDLEIYLGED